MKYRLYINGVWYEDFKTLKEIDQFLFEQGIDNSDKYYIVVKKLKEKRGKKIWNVKENLNLED